MKKIFLTSIILCIAHLAFSQSAHKLLRSGNDAYEDEDYAAAAEDYYKALEKEPDNIKGKFNLGNATYKTDGYDEAIQHFSAAAELAKDDKIKSDAYYNLGNAHFQKAQAAKGEGLEKSIEAYKKSLRLNPSDMDTKKNLALTQRLLQRQQQQQQQQQQQKDQENQEQKEEEQQQQEQQENQSQQNQDQQEQQPQEQEAAKDLNKEEAMELLKIMDDEEKKVQEKLRKAKGNGKKPLKDW